MALKRKLIKWILFCGVKALLEKFINKVKKMVSTLWEKIPISQNSFWEVHVWEVNKSLTSKGRDDIGRGSFNTLKKRKNFVFLHNSASVIGTITN